MAVRYNNDFHPPRKRTSSAPEAKRRARVDQLAPKPFRTVPRHVGYAALAPVQAAEKIAFAIREKPPQFRSQCEEYFADPAPETLALQRSQARHRTNAQPLKVGHRRRANLASWLRLKILDFLVRCRAECVHIESLPTRTALFRRMILSERSRTSEKPCNFSGSCSSDNNACGRCGYNSAAGRRERCHGKFYGLRYSQ